MRLTRCAATLLVAAILTSTAKTAFATIINVPDDQQTIQRAINASQNGDTVLVQPGVYEEIIRITNRTVTLASLFLLQNEPDLIEQTILDGGGMQTVVTISGWENRTVLHGFSIRNGLGQGAAVNVIEASPTLRHINAYENEGLHGTISCSSAENVTWDHLNIHDNHSETSLTSGILVTETTTLTVRDLIIRDNSSLGAGAFYVQFPGRNVLTVERAEIYNNVAENESIAEIQQSGTLNLIECHAYNNMGGEDYEAVRTWLAAFSAEKSLFVGNGEEGNPRFFETYDFPPRNHIIYGCTIIGYNDVAIDCGHGLTDVKSTIFWGNGNAVGGHQTRGNVRCDYCLGEGIEGADNISTDPLFRDPENGDYHLRADSPCIDFGDPDADRDPDGSRADMGAFYFHQRDIQVEPENIVFPSIPWETLDSQVVQIRNTGGNDLHLTTIELPLHPSFFFFLEQIPFDPPIPIPPDSAYQLWIYYYPQWEGRGQAHPSAVFGITSDDPDENTVGIEVTSDPMSAPSDNLHSSFFTLHSAFPNPFNSSTTIRFSTSPINREATLRVYGLDGRLVEELWTGGDAYPTEERQAGRLSYAEERPINRVEQVTWNAEGLPGGVYLVRLESCSEVRTIKAVLMK